MTTRFNWDSSVATVYSQARALGGRAAEQWRDALAPSFRSGDIVIDLGCGTGNYVGYLRDWFGCEVIGIDQSTAMLAEARAASDESLLAALAQSLPIAVGAVDVVFLSNVVHHLDLVPAAREVGRVLRPGGRAVIRNVFPDHADEMPLYQFFPAARLLDEATYPRVNDVVAAFTDAGFGLSNRATVRQVTAESKAEYADRTGRRAVSSLQLISDEEFREGMERLHLAAQAEDTAEPVWTPLELLVLTNT